MLDFLAWLAAADGFYLNALVLFGDVRNLIGLRRKNLLTFFWSPGSIWWMIVKSSIFGEMGLRDLEEQLVIKT